MAPLHFVVALFGAAGRGRLVARAPRHSAIHATERVALSVEDQFRALVTEQEDFWRGLWTTYDADGTAVDEMEVDSAWVKDKSGGLIMVNSYYIGAVRANCDTCQDSMTVRQLQVGDFSSSKMAGIHVCGPGVAFGPKLTANGNMLAEVGIRQGASRLRVAWTYATQPELVDDQLVLDLKRFVVVREALDRPPLRDEARSSAATRPSGDAADFWRPYEEPWGMATAVAQVERRELVEDGDTAFLTAGEIELPEGQCASAPDVNLRLEGGIGLGFRKRLLVKAGGEPWHLTAVWQPEAGEQAWIATLSMGLQAADGAASEGDEALGPRFESFRVDRVSAPLP